LLRAISSAQPKVAEYAFTTISPQLGAVSTDGGISSFVVADIPGLIEGAHENRGLGHNFLRHVERCAAFVYVVDLGAGAGGRPGVRPWNALQTLMAELEAYLPGLSARPAIVVGTKADLPNSSRAAETLRRRTTLPVVMVSAHESRGIQDMLSKADELLHQTQRGKDAYEY
jgi:GTP-binding protein